jgi:hypothetical protein
MKAAAFLMSLIAVPVALPSHARDWDDLGSWSVEELCENKDKRRHEEAIFAELERRGVFSPFDLELVRSGEIDVGMGEAALHCSWGAPISMRQQQIPAWKLPDSVKPDSVKQRNSDAWLTYRRRIDGYRRTFDVFIVAERVTEISVRQLDPGVPYVDAGDPRLFSETPVGGWASGFCQGPARSC